MTDVFSSEKRSEVMRAIRAKNTKPELVLRRALHRLGFRFRLHDSTLAGKPDIVLPKYRTLIQVRGCFWHGHTCSDGHIPKSRLDYWSPKIGNNKLRDRKNDSRNRRLGWSVLVVWECRLAGEAHQPGSQAGRRVTRRKSLPRCRISTIAEAIPRLFVGSSSVRAARLGIALPSIADPTPAAKCGMRREQIE